MGDDHGSTEQRWGGLREILPSVEHQQHRYLNNRAEHSHQPTRQRERRLGRCKSPCEEIREAKDRFGLALGIGMQRVRANLRAVLQQAVQDIHGFPHPAGNEAAEQGDVGVRDVVVADSTPPAIPNMVLTEQVLFVDVPFGAVR